MTLTKKQREWLRDVKERAERDYINQSALITNLREIPLEGYKHWES